MPEGRTEAGLVDAARGGDRNAMESLVLLHQDRVLAVLHRCVPADDVEDLAQEAFLRVFRQIDRFRGDAAFGTWLFRVVRNLMIDRYRTRQRTPERIGLREQTLDPLDAVIEDPGPGPDEEHARRALEIRLRTALGALDAKDRLAVILSDQERMGAAEVASIVGGSAGAIRIRLMRARGKLRKALTEGEA